MPDPITIGSLVAAALAAGAAEAGKAVLGGAAKHAYEALASAASRALGPVVGLLVKKPEAESHAVVVAELVEDQPPEVQAELKQLAEALRAALTTEGRGATIDNRMTVIATHNSIAAGGNVTIGAIPEPE